MDVDQITSQGLKSLTENPTSIPIPDVSYLKKVESQVATTKKRDGELVKYEREYDLFCHWSALPGDLRKPETAGKFELKYKLPKNYTQVFKQRKDFRSRQLTYFWEWLMDIFPDVVYSQYRLTQKSGNTAAAKFFSELVSKRLDADKSDAKITNFFLVGVDQSKIDKLFVPKDYEDVVPEKV